MYDLKNPIENIETVFAIFFSFYFPKLKWLIQRGVMSKKCKGVVGYSGAFLDGDIPNNIIKNDILLIHGERDNIVPIARMKHAISKLSNMSNSLETNVCKQLEHSINEEGLILGCNFIKKRL